MLYPSYTENLLEAGCDEVGRGCLAGPVVAAAVILPKSFFHPWLKDSKKVGLTKRIALDPILKAEALAWAIGAATPEEIDDINIANASYLAMHRAIDRLKMRPQLLLVDGKYFNAYANLPHVCIVQGDNTFQAIAAASIIAKNYRDNYMQNLAQQFPDYAWEKNIGYPTLAHRHAIKKLGLTPHHRKSYQMSL